MAREKTDCMEDAGAAVPGPQRILVSWRGQDMTQSAARPLHSAFGGCPSCQAGCGLLVESGLAGGRFSA